MNYVYSLLECEARLALLWAGLDPTLGVLHADQRNRESFALDAMEPIRAAVGAFVLDLLEERVLTSRNFVELPNGVCRVRAPLTYDLAVTLPRWRQLMAPIAAHLAQTFRSAMGRAAMPAVALPRTASHTTAKPALAPSPLVTTPRKVKQPRPYESKAWSAPWPEPLLLTPIACAACGGPVAKRRRRHCDACIPTMKVAQAIKAVAVARKTLAAKTAAGKDPRNDPEVNCRRAAAISKGHQRNRERAREHRNERRDEVWFRCEVTPKLDGFSLNEIATATGLSLTACSRIRPGARVPHPRHGKLYIRWSVTWDRGGRARIAKECATQNPIRIGDQIQRG